MLIKIIKTTVLGLSLCATQSLVAQEPTKKTSVQGYFEDRERGWFWYEEPPVEIDEEEEELPQQTSTAPPTPLPALSPKEILKKQGEQMEEAMAIAILNPSLENYRRYLELSNKIQQQSQDFARGMKQAIWITPEYDYRLQKPVNTQAQVAQAKINSEEEQHKLNQAANKYGLVFFFRSDCPYCHKFAPILKKLAQRFDFQIMDVSLDGQGIKEYPNPQPNLELGKRLNVEVVPALFMIDTKENIATPVSYGFSDWTALKNKITVAAQKMQDNKNTTRIAQ